MEQSDDDYEEIEDYDPEFSVFGSEQVVEKKAESVLGKRNRGEWENGEQLDNALTLRSSK